MIPIATLVVRGRVKSRIKCRAYAELTFKELKELDDEFILGVAHLLPKEKATEFDELVEVRNVCIELYAREPNMFLIKKFFEDERRRTMDLTKHFESKIKELKIDPAIPKITKNETGGEDKDYTTLEDATNLLFDYKNRLNFINECIFEIGMYERFEQK